jgi:PhnB protein
MVRAIPEGFHSVTPYLTVNNAAAAIDFYKRAFEARETSRLNDPDGKNIINAELKIEDSIVLLSDEFPQESSRSPSSIGGTAVTLHIYTEDVDRVFNQAISAGATVVMPIMDAFLGR